MLLFWGNPEGPPSMDYLEKKPNKNRGSTLDEFVGTDPAFKKVLKADEGDRVFQPKHYTQWKVEPITFVMENKIPFAEGSVIKYIMRHNLKNGSEDIRKAMRYCEMILEQTYGESGPQASDALREEKP